MGFRICFPLFGPPRVVRRWFCIDIPVLYDPFWKLRGPGPLFQVDGKTPVWAGDAIALATIRSMIPNVSRGVAKQLEAASKGILASVKEQLPDGAQTSFTRGRRA